ncbi:MAG: pilus assembly protein PilM [Candidatus Omnitrophica bacterium]|jgi:type IV pilus assembly protein PilM|nr:pilus assembly protein PilM [Candidatus Omnitrophota bacterium]
MAELNVLDLKKIFIKPRISIGLDSGTSFVKLVKFSFKNNLLELCGFDNVPVRADPQETLKPIFHFFNDTKFVNLSLCGSSTTVRYVTLPKMTEDELRKSIKFEAQKYIPFPAQEVNLDAAILKNDTANNNMFVAVAASKKDYTSQRVKLATENNLIPSFMDHDALAVVNAFIFNEVKAEKSNLPKTVALLNIGASYSTLSILEEGVPVLSRDISIAGNNFTHRIAENLSLDFSSAEKIKVSPPDDKIEQIKLAVEPVLASLATEIRVSFDYYESQSALNVEKIFLSGGTALLEGLPQSLSGLLDIEISGWDPLKRILIADGLDAKKLKSLSGQLAVAVGLALRG